MKSIEDLLSKSAGQMANKGTLPYPSHLASAGPASSTCSRITQISSATQCRSYLVPSPDWIARGCRAAAQAAINYLNYDSTGCTVDPRCVQVLHAVDCWAVSLQGYEASRKTMSAEVIARYVFRHHEIFFQRDDVYLGIWLDKQRKKYCLDITTLHPEKLIGIKVARRRKQKGIFNLLTERLLEIGK